MVPPIGHFCCYFMYCVALLASLINQIYQHASNVLLWMGARAKCNLANLEDPSKEISLSIYYIWIISTALRKKKALLN